MKFKRPVVTALVISTASAWAAWAAPDLPEAVSGADGSRPFARAFRGTTAATGAASAASNDQYQDWFDQARGRTIPVKLYLPSGNGPFPVVIFSHGLGGSRDAAPYLGDYWSQHGYLCLFVQHPGSDTSAWASAKGLRRQQILTQLRAAANAKNMFDRANDVKFVLDELERRNQSDPLLKGKADMSAVAMSGHSMGAGTTLLFAGIDTGNLDVTDPRIKAAVYLCAPVRRGPSPEKTYGKIKMPGLFLTGTKDDSPINDTTAAERRIPFDGTRAHHQYLITFNGANHGMFGAGRMAAPYMGSPKFYEEVERVTTDFLDAALKHQENCWTWLDTQAAGYLGSDAVLEKK